MTADPFDILLFAVCLFFIGLCLGTLQAESRIKHDLRKKGTAQTGSKCRLVGHVEQKIDGFKDRWEKVGGEE